MPTILDASLKDKVILQKWEVANKDGTKKAVNDSWARFHIFTIKKCPASLTVRAFRRRR